MLYNTDVALWENLPYPNNKLIVQDGCVIDVYGDVIGRFKDNGHAEDTLRAAGYSKESSVWIKRS